MNQRSKVLTTLTWVSLILLAVATWMVLVFAPEEKVMGEVQRIFYFHVSAGWLGLIGFLVALAAGIAYLITRDRKWDIVGVAGVEVGMVFFFINIVTGSIWARPAWNTWWTWDPRLVTATITELIYMAYFMLRQGVDEPDRRARFGAVYAIVGSVSVPLTFYSIRIWRTIHPVVIGSANPDAEGGFAMTADMKTAFFFSLFTFTVIGVTLLWHRIRLGRLTDHVEELKMKAFS